MLLLSGFSQPDAKKRSMEAVAGGAGGGIIFEGSFFDGPERILFSCAFFKSRQFKVYIHLLFVNLST